MTISNAEEALGLLAPPSIPPQRGGGRVVERRGAGVSLDTPCAGMTRCEVGVRVKAEGRVESRVVQCPTAMVGEK